MRVLSIERWRGPAALLAVVIVLVTLAVTHRGVPAAEVDLNDGGVWVTNEQLHLAAHLNYPSRTLDGGLRAASSQFDLTQRGNSVLLHDRGSAALAPIDPANLTLGDGSALGDEFSVAQGGETTAVLHATTGRLWVLPTPSAGTFDANADPTVENADGLLATVGTDGTAHALAPDGTLTRITMAGGKPTSRRAGSISDLKDFAQLQLSVVGETPVVLDPTGGSVRTQQGATTLPNAVDAVLQQPGPEADTAIVASPTALVWAPLAGGTPTEKPNAPGQPNPGTPVQPAFLNGCAYGAWAGSGAYLRDCLDDTADQTATLDRAKGASKLRFRVNRDVIVLNDVATGLVVLVNDEHRVVDNWQTVQSQVDAHDKATMEHNQTTSEQAPEEASRQDFPPVALPDEFGVRAGRSTTLPVLANDSSPSGGALTATALASPRLGPVDQVRGGQALRITAPDDAQGTDEFTYRAEDGRGGSAEALVRVSVHPPNRNDPPRQLSPATVSLGQGDEISVAVLGHWLDPNGDGIFLSDAQAPEGLSVRHRPDGVVTIRDLDTGATGAKEIALTVSDGTATGQGVLTVQVKPKADLPPVANADHAVTWQGQEVVIKPLLNDTDPNGTPPRLASVAEAGAGQRVRTDMAAGTVAFQAENPGTYYLEYSITDGPNQATGQIRIDVRAPAPDSPPIADDDIAQLSAGGVGVVDVLANDSDPAGGVLVIQRVDVPAGSPVTVEIVDQARLRVSAPAGLTEQAAFTYTMSNGVGSANGQVTVLPLPSGATTVPPIATDDTGIVRAGDIVTIPVLANDASPVGMPLELQPEITLVSGDPGGTAFVAGRTLRYRAGQVPGAVRLTYTITDSAGNPASAQVAISVTAPDAANSPPQPQPLVGRVLAGNKVRIPVPTDSVDPEGDSVTLSGISRAPAKGTAELGATWIDFTAPADAVGGDSLTYVVTDRYGQNAEGEIRIGIAPPPATNQAPIAVPDSLTVRPERHVLVPVLDNDVDPDGDTLALVPDSVVPADQDTPANSAFVEADALVADTGPAGVRRYFYDVTDNRGGIARGVATLAIDADAPLKAPIARDDVLAATEVVGKNSIEVEVLANDSDPDGHLGDATLEASEAGATVSGDRITVPVTDQRQVILYSVTDRDGLTGRAAIIVPPGQRLPPMLIPEKIPARVKAGETLRIPLGDYVRVRDGRTPILTAAERVTAGAGGDGSPLVPEPTTLAFTPQATFAGRTSLTFEVTDGTTPDDPNGLSATLSLPIEVEPAQQAQEEPKTQPVFRPSGATVAPFEPAVRLDLRAMVTDPDPGDMDRLAFTLGPVTGGFDARLEGATLVVSAPDQTPAGTAGGVAVTVTDGSTEPVTGQVPIQSIASNRPRIQVREATIPDARAGQPSQVDLSAYITNPFAAENRPVTMVGAPQVTAGAGTATAAGLNVTVTPAANTNGQVVVTYQLADATGDPARQVQGLIRLTVQDRPAAPTGVRAVTQASRTATVSWTAGAANGSPITGFSVRYAGGQQDCGMVTTCTITGLTNGQTYAFTVVATNAVGESVPSAPSNPVRPDARPNAPGAPQVTVTEGQAAVTWAPATTEGSPVTSYTVEISPAAGGAQRQVPGNSLTWTGLTNGTAYTFRVRAHSAADEPSDWSPWSAQAIPVGPPGTPAAPTAVLIESMAAQVTWTAPVANGDPNLTYELMERHYDPGRTWERVVYSGPALNARLGIVESDRWGPALPGPVEFRVRALNRSGASPWSSASTRLQPQRPPGPITYTVEATGVNNQVRIQADTPQQLPGASVTSLWRANGQGGVIPADGRVTSAAAFPNGQAVNVEVFIRQNVSGHIQDGPSGPSETVTAYGAPRTPNLRCTGTYLKVVCSWSGGEGNGRPTSYELSGDVATRRVQEPQGSIDFETGGDPRDANYGEASSRRLCVQAVQEGGARGALNCAQATSLPGLRPNPPPTTSRPAEPTRAATTTQPPVQPPVQPPAPEPPPRPAPSYSWARGGAASGCPSGWSQCNSILLSLRNYQPNSNVVCTVPGVGGGQNWSATIRVNADGHWGQDTTPTGSPYALRVGNMSVGNDFGTCRQA